MNAPERNNNQQGMQLRIRGTVQGVGFRPFIAQLANQFMLTGNVTNDANGVLINVWGPAEKLRLFSQQIADSPPPLAVIDTIETSPLTQLAPNNGFTINHSIAGMTNTHIPADSSICEDCLAELNDPNDRRYHYPFINCTHCGPRLSIIEKIPYDRPFTSMSKFAMCPQCEQEYQNPHSRRYHAQPNACPNCGPKIWLEDNAGNLIETEAETVLESVADALKQGKIIALKGLGGFHLACDARNYLTVARLRQSKRRDTKPLALMAKDLAQLENYADITELERSLLTSQQAPIVLLPCKSKHDLATNIAPDQNTLGFMLPYTPLHQLLMQLLNFPIVLTSGNESDTPQCIDNDEAKQTLNHIADAFLLHDRDIVNRLDDSVIRVISGQARLLRRGRGYTPASIQLHQDFSSAKPVLAMGAELKSTFCLLRQGQAIVSQHIGDLENQAVLNEYCHSLDLYQQLYDFTPHRLAADLHLDYLSTQYAENVASHFQCELTPVQHHHAHIAAVMAENRLGFDAKVLGLAFDGLGMGTDKQLWGGEVMLSSYTENLRLATIESTSLIGGSQAMRQPWRNLYAQLHRNWNDVSTHFDSIEVISKLKSKPLSNIDKLIQQQINSPKASSLGRVFDAVAALLDMCFEQQSFEGQAAMQLEALATAVFEQEKLHSYHIDVDWHQQPVCVHWQQMWQQILTDLDNKIPKAKIAARFHHSLIQVFTDIVLHFSQDYPNLPVVLSGGVFQNKLLHEGLTTALHQQDKIVLSSSLIPCNDGAISLGQAVIAAAQQSSLEKD